MLGNILAISSIALVALGLCELRIHRGTSVPITMLMGLGITLVAIDWTDANRILLISDVVVNTIGLGIFLIVSHRRLHSEQDLRERMFSAFKQAIQETIARRLVHYPIDTIIDNRIEDVLSPQIGPIVQRVAHDAQARLDKNIVAALCEVIEDKIGDDELLVLLKEAIKSVAQALPKNATNRVVPSRAPATAENGHRHAQFELVRSIVGPRKMSDGSIIPGTKVLMVGPSGAGKSLIAQHIAAELGLPFYFNGPLQSEYKLTGFKDANGQYHHTPFRQAYEHGGVYLFDELDACSAQALVAFNTALSNKICDFPDGPVDQHENFICLAAANTYGHGATAAYAGRERIDGATLDRFAVVDIQYDERLELGEANNPDWVRRVHKVRRGARSIQPPLSVSMSAFLEGAKLLAKGIHISEVEKAVLWRGRTEKQIAEIKKEAGI